jgi:hypothetical protein
MEVRRSIAALGRSAAVAKRSRAAWNTVGSAISLCVLVGGNLVARWREWRGRRAMARGEVPPMSVGTWLKRLAEK